MIRRTFLQMLLASPLLGLLKKKDKPRREFIKHGSGGGSTEVIEPCDFPLSQAFVEQVTGSFKIAFSVIHNIDIYDVKLHVYISEPMSDIMRFALTFSHKNILYCYNWRHYIRREIELIDSTYIDPIVDKIIERFPRLK